MNQSFDCKYRKENEKMKMQTFIVKIGTLLGSIKGAFLEAFAGNLFSGSVNCSGSRRCVVDRLFYN